MEVRVISERMFLNFQQRTAKKMKCIRRVGADSCFLDFACNVNFERGLGATTETAPLIK